MPRPDRCPTPDVLEQLLLGQLAQPMADLLVAHLEQCERCAAAAGGVRSESALIAAARSVPTHWSEDDDTLVQELIEQNSNLIVSHDSRSGPTSFQSASDRVVFEEYLGSLWPPQQMDEIGRLGSYRLLDVLGAGGMGIVFLAEDEGLQRRVALKVIKPQLACNPTIRQRFLREARLAAAIEDDHIVAIHQVGEDRGVPFIAMQLLQGQSLQDRLRKSLGTFGHPLPMAELLKIGIQVAKGLASAHARGLVHRDIKPANIWLEHEGSNGDARADSSELSIPFRRVKLLDFGVARELDRDVALTQTGILTGTPAYLAPEQFSGGPVDARCDLFSLGCVLYEMATGHSPFSKADAASTLHAISSVEPLPPQQVNAELPSELSRLIIELLDKDPAQRPSSAREVAQRLQQIEDGTQASRRSLASKTSKWRFSSAAVLTIATAAFVAIIATRNDKSASTIDTDGPRVPAQVIESRADASTSAAADDWAMSLGELPAAEQIERFTERLRSLNPEFDGHVITRVLDEAVVELELETDQISDLSPIAGLKNLQRLVCRGSGPGTGRLSDLTPIRSLSSLQSLDCSDNQISDLLVLKGLPLHELVCAGNPVEDLTAIAEVPLTTLDISRTFVNSLAHVGRMPLTNLDVRLADVREFWPLEEIRTLRVIHCSFRPQRHAATLRSMTFLREINNQSTDAFWHAFDARQASLDEWFARVMPLSDEEKVEEVRMKLKELNPQFDGQIFPQYTAGKVTVFQVFVDNITDLEPIRALTHIERLIIRGTEAGYGALFDLDPVGQLPLQFLECGFTQVADLSPLGGTGLRVLLCRGTRVRDLRPVHDLPLFYFECTNTPVEDLSPLIGSATTILYIRGTRVRDFSPLLKIRVTRLSADLDPVRDRALLLQIPTLKTFNETSVTDLW